MIVSVSLLIMPLFLSSRIWFAFVAAGVHWLVFSLFNTMTLGPIQRDFWATEMQSHTGLLVILSQVTFHLSLLNFILFFLGHYSHLSRCHTKIPLLSEVFISPWWQQFGVISKLGEGALNSTIQITYKDF